MANDIHQWVEERLSEYLDNRLASAERALLEAHLRDCVRCQASLESLRWTVSLLKQAPVPAASRAFTLPVAQKTARAGGFSFGFLRAATALAAVLLCVVVGLDFYSQVGLRGAAAPAPAAQIAAPTSPPNVALAAPTTAPAATSAPAATAAPLQPAAQPGVLPSATRALNAGAEPPRTPAQADALKTAATAAAPAAPPAPRAAITNTVAAFSPLATAAPSATVPAPTATMQVEARTQPTAAPTNAVSAETPRGFEFPVRVMEAGLLALLIILGGLTFFAWRRK